MKNAKSNICAFFLLNKCNKGDNCSFVHDVAPKDSGSRTICQYFQRGTCAFGQQCRSSHEAEQDTNIDSSPSVQNQKRPTCKYFTKGECRNEEDCPYLHASDGDANANNFASPTKEKTSEVVCRYWKAGSCNKGNACPFQHEDTTVVQNSKDSSSSPSAGPADSSAHLHTSMPRSKSAPSGTTASRHGIDRTSAKNSPSSKSVNASQSSSPGTRTPASSFGRHSNAEVNLSDRQEGIQHQNVDADIVSSETSALQITLADTVENPASKEVVSFLPESSISACAETSTSTGSSAPANDSYTKSRVLVPESVVYAPPYQDPSVGPLAQGLVPYPYMNPYNFQLSHPFMYQMPYPPAASGTPLSPLSMSPALSSSFPSSSTPNNAPLCQHFAHGGCYLGPSCRFRHFLTEEELKKINGTDELQKQTTNEPTSGSSADNDVGTERNAAVRPRMKLRCHFWTTNNCKNGDECPYLHEGPQISSTATARNNLNSSDNASGATTGFIPQQDQRLSSSRPCRFFASESGCMKGNQCTFFHDPSLVGSALNQYGDEKAEEKKEETPATDAWGCEGSYQGQEGDDDPWGVKALTANTSSGQGHDSWAELSWDTPWSSTKTTRQDNNRNGKQTNGSRRDKEGTKSGDTSGTTSRKTPIPLKDWDTKQAGQRARSKREGNDKSRTPSSNGWDGVQASTSQQNQWESGSVAIGTPEHDAKSGLTRPPSQSTQLTVDTEVFDEAGPEGSNFMEDTPATPSEPPFHLNALQTVADLELPLPNPASNEDLDHITSSNLTGVVTTERREGEHISSAEEWAEPEGQDLSQWNSNEDTWQDSSWTQDSVEHTGNNPRKSNQPCRLFGQGYCKWGDECYYLHIPQEPVAEDGEFENKVNGMEPEGYRDATHGSQSEQQNAYDTVPPLPIEHRLFQCSVGFGIGASPKEILTPFESTTLRIFNISYRGMEEDIKALLDPFGTVRGLELELSSQGTTQSARVDYDSVAEAAIAARGLDKTEFMLTQLSVELQLPEPFASIVYNWLPSSHSRCVKLSYPTPSRAAWVYYDSISQAKKSLETLEGALLAGRKVKVTMPRPGKKQTHSFALRVENLPPDVEQSAVRALCQGSKLVQMISSSYTDSPRNEFDRILGVHGHVESINILPFTKVATHAIALACFTEVASTTKAVDSLNNTSQSFLGDGILKVQQVFYVRRQLDSCKFVAVREELNRIGHIIDTTNVQIFCEGDANGDEEVEIHIVGLDAMSLARAQKLLEPLIRGHILLSDSGAPLWDEYFEVSSSHRAFQRINRDQTFFVERDFRRRHVLLFGNQSSRLRAKESVLRLLDMVNQQRHILDLSDVCIGDLLNGELQSLEEELGPNKVTLDLVSRAFIVRGDADVREKVWRAVQRCGPLPSDSGDDNCKLCSLATSDPVTLAGCEHKYCTRCLQRYIRTMIGSSFAPIQCVAYTGEGEEQCSTQLAFSLIQSLLSESELANLLEISFLSHVQACTQELKICPTPNCEMVFRPGTSGTVMRCPACRVWICGSCCVELHEGLTCAQYLSLSSESDVL